MSFPIVFAIAWALVLGIGGGFLTTIGSWYHELEKPGWQPPDWLFGPAWTILYLMIAIAGWRIWIADGYGAALLVWCVNLVFNAAWSWLMFCKHRIDLALADAIAMLLTILAFISLALPHDAIAAYLFVPYLLWVAYATALNGAILQRNPEPQ